MLFSNGSRDSMSKYFAISASFHHRSRIRVGCVGIIIGARVWKSSGKADIFLKDSSSIMPGRCYQFGAFRLDTGTRTLFRDGNRVALAPKAVEVLIVLVEAEGDPVSKERILEQAWPGAVV